MFYIQLAACCFVLGFFAGVQESSAKFSSQQFKKQMACVLGDRKSAKIKEYGCICQKINERSKITPVDKLDRCCKERHKCYASNKCKIKKQPEYKVKYKCDEKRSKNKINCGKNRPGKCRHISCTCDHQATLCLKKNYRQFNKRFFNMTDARKEKMCVAPTPPTPKPTPTEPPPTKPTPTEPTPKEPTPTEPTPTTKKPPKKPAVAPIPKAGEFCGDTTEAFAWKSIINVVLQEFSSKRDYPKRALLGGRGKVDLVVGEIITIKVTNLAPFYPWYLTFEVNGVKSVTISLLTFDDSPIDIKGLKNPLKLKIEDPDSFTLVTLPLPEKFRKKIVAIQVKSNKAVVREFFAGICFKPLNPIDTYEFFDDTDFIVTEPGKEGDDPRNSP